MSLDLGDPVEKARREADSIKADHHRLLSGPIERAMADCPFVHHESLLAGLEQFHRERMAKIPSPARYPEAAPWVEHALAVDKELQAAAGLTDAEMASYRSLSDYLKFRGYINARPATVEKCRVVYLPESDRGQLHIKNVDDPITFWKPSPDPGAGASVPKGLIWDGVGCGLHMDDEPEEIFPLPVHSMCSTYCDDVPSAVEFLTRYSPFWGGANIVLHDDAKRSVAIEKGSHNHIEVFEPDASGGSHCSGMAFRDPESPLSKYARGKRLEYLKQFNQPLDGSDMTYWNACDLAEEMLAELMSKPSVTVQEVFDIFTTPWPEGLNKPGVKLHPDQGYPEYTLRTHGTLIDARLYYIWQRDAEGVYPDEPVVVEL